MTSSPDFVLPAWLDPGAAAASPPPAGGEAAGPPDAAAWAPPDLGDGRRGAAGRGRPRTRDEEAFARGLAEGERVGEARAAQHLAPALAALYGVAQGLAEARERWERDRERDLEGLALAVARALLQREVSVEPAVVRDLVARALDLLPAESTVDVRLHPVDLAALASTLEELHAAGRGLTLQWIADDALERGSFVLETPARVVDGRVDVALRELYERLGA
jgi:flagellar biosynthesis/type III secretory pathway protein FliH